MPPQDLVKLTRRRDRGRPVLTWADGRDAETGTGADAGAGAPLRPVSAAALTAARGRAAAGLSAGGEVGARAGMAAQDAAGPAGAPRVSAGPRPPMGAFAGPGMARRGAEAPPTAPSTGAPTSFMRGGDAAPPGERRARAASAAGAMRPEHRGPAWPSAQPSVQPPGASPAKAGPGPRRCASPRAAGPDGDDADLQGAAAPARGMGAAMAARSSGGEAAGAGATGAGAAGAGAAGRPRPAPPPLALGRVHEFCGSARAVLAAMVAGRMGARLSCMAEAAGGALAPEHAPERPPGRDRAAPPGPLSRGGPVLWIRPAHAEGRLNPDGLSPFFDPARLVLATPSRAADILWIAEEALRSGAAPLVIAEPDSPPGLTPVRRLHLAAEAGEQAAQAHAGAHGAAAPMALLLSPGTGGAQGVESRWALAPTDSAPSGKGPAWRLELLRARLSPPRAWRVRWDAAELRAEDEGPAPVGDEAGREGMQGTKTRPGRLSRPARAALARDLHRPAMAWGAEGGRE